MHMVTTGVSAPTILEIKATLTTFTLLFWDRQDRRFRVAGIVSTNLAGLAYGNSFYFV